MEQEPQQHEVKNKNRRNALAFGLTGVVAFVMGKLFGNDLINLFGGNEVVDKKEFNNFLLTETKNEMTLSDKSGEPIVIIDKESFRE